jgi:DNA-binding CsgD family transcriptional regulator
MHNDIHLLHPIDYRTFRTGLAIDKSHCDCKDPLDHFHPLIQNFESMAIGRNFWFILDFPKGQNCASGGDVEHLTPFTHKVFSSLSQLELHEATHPEDLNKVLAFSRFWIEMFDRYDYEVMCDLNVTLFFRMLNVTGKYYWIMVEYPEVILDNRNKIVYGLVLVTDVSHIKSHGEPMMNILYKKKFICQQFICLNKNNLPKPKLVTSVLTRREMEILKLVTKGHGSKQIASLLYISNKTVDNHRQNMLRKTGCRSSSELVSLGIRVGIV